MVGKFFLQDAGEMYRTGEFVEQVSPESWLARYDAVGPEGPPVEPMLMVHVADMCGLDPEDEGQWFVFETREDLRKWLAWLETPETPKVKLVNFKGKKT